MTTTPPEQANVPATETESTASTEASTTARPDSFVHEFARIDENGTVYVIDAGIERQIGGYPEGAPADPFALYERRFADLEATVKLFEDRLATLSPKDIDQTLASIVASVKEPAAIGDLQGLRNRVEALKARAEARKEEAKAEHKAARAQALAQRTRVVEQAEAIVTQTLEKTHWKQSGQILRDLLDEWKTLQRKGPRLDKTSEDDLWKRFSSARTQFDRNRRQYFSALDQAQSEAKRMKEALIAEAEALSSSTDWAATSAAYRELMNRWKRAPRASRKEDDALWARFRAAQQKFFDARRAKDEATDNEYRENLAAKEALLVEAEAIVPISELEAAKAALRSVQDRWDAIGRVPSSDLHRIESRLRAVERAIREAEEKEWRKTNPETRARAEGMLGQLEAQIEGLQADLASAQAAGDEDSAKALAEALATKRSWLEQIRSTMA